MGPRHYAGARRTLTVFCYQPKRHLREGQKNGYLTPENRSKWAQGVQKTAGLCVGGVSAKVPPVKNTPARPFVSAPTVSATARNFAIAGVLFGLLISCGKPATEAECIEILRRAAELELRGRLDGSDQLIEEEVALIEKRLREPMMKKCVGKRITESAMQCIRQARSSKELFDDCFR